MFEESDFLCDEGDFRYIIDKYKNRFEQSQDVRNSCEIIPREMKENGFIIDEFKSFETKGKIVNNCDILKSFVDCYNFEHDKKYLFYDEYYIGNYKKKICETSDIRSKFVKNANSSLSINNYIKSIWS
tara:strand:+ start:233 stop:616 length:384 start_codon:yes stop_codon:yes gene_type:complete